MAKIELLGISGSPVPNSNTDNLIKTILKASEVESEFVKLSDITVGPCIACKKCVDTNECIINDDFKSLSKKVIEADAIVLGSPVMYGAASAFTKAFIERLWSLRHRENLTQGKLAVTSVVGWAQPEAVEEWMANILQMDGMEVLGGVIANGSPGCFVCGQGETCAHSHWNFAKIVEELTGMSLGFEKIYESYLEELPDNDPQSNPSYNILKCISIDDQPQAIQKAEELGKLLGSRIRES